MKSPTLYPMPPSLGPEDEDNHLAALSQCRDKAGDVLMPTDELARHYARNESDRRRATGKESPALDHLADHGFTEVSRSDTEITTAPEVDPEAGDQTRFERVQIMRWLSSSNESLTEEWGMN